MAVEDPNEALELTHQLCILFLVVGIVMFFAAVFQTHWFNMAGVYLSTRIRSMTFSAMLKQEMGWFDDDENSVGALSARLTGDAANIQGVKRKIFNLILFFIFLFEKKKNVFSISD